MAIDPHSNAQSAPAVNKSFAVRLITAICELLTPLSERDKKARRRERIRQDLVQAQFHNGPAEQAFARPGLASHLCSFLKLRRTSEGVYPARSKSVMNRP